LGARRIDQRAVEESWRKTGEEGKSLERLPDVVELSKDGQSVVTLHGQAASTEATVPRALTVAER